MPNSNGSRPYTISASSIQPKFKDCSFDSKTALESFRTWIVLIAGIVRALPFGPVLENFLDFYLKREYLQSHTRPAFLDDPVLSLGRLTDPSQGSDGTTS